MDKCIISLTSVPEKLKYLNEFDMRCGIERLLNLNYENYEVHLNLPDKLKSTNEQYVIPDWLKKMDDTYDKLKIFSGLEDMGPITKVYYTLDRISDPEQLIIVLDDDMLYRKNLIEEHIENQKKFPNCVVGYDALAQVDNEYDDIRYHWCSGLRKSIRVKILQHWKTISYKRKYFGEDFRNFVDENFIWNDDILVSAYMAYRKINRIVTYHPTDNTKHEYEDLDEWREQLSSTFPIDRYLQHCGNSGCNKFRNDANKFWFDPGNLDERETTLYTKYLDKSKEIETVPNLGIVK